MSKSTGLFKEAISILNLMNFRTDISNKVIEKIDLTIRFLEIAGKIDKKKGLLSLREIYGVASLGRLDESLNEIYTLLESLPDGVQR